MKSKITPKTTALPMTMNHDRSGVDAPHDLPRGKVQREQDHKLDHQRPEFFRIAFSECAQIEQRPLIEIE